VCMGWKWVRVLVGLARQIATVAECGGAGLQAQVVPQQIGVGRARGQWGRTGIRGHLTVLRVGGHLKNLETWREAA
jgi:hypothetical protein